MSPEEIREALDATKHQWMNGVVLSDFEIVREAARAYADLLENGPDYEAGLEAWRGLHGLNGQTPRATIHAVRIIVDAALVVPVEPSANQVLTDSDLAVGGSTLGRRKRKWDGIPAHHPEVKP